MSMQPPPIEHVTPAASRYRRPPPNKITPGEAFKRGFYGGFGLWCSFMVLNVIFAIFGVMVLMALGVIGSAMG